jgi:ATP diphosphatase
MTTSAAAQAAADIQRLIEVVARLRAPGGCAWDRQQTIDSLKPYVLEETYELLEAIDQHDHEGIREELGDCLFEAVFVAQIEAEAGHGSIGEAARHAADKLVRRHPHVFARSEGQPELDAAMVSAQWERIKAEERGNQARPGGLLRDVPSGLPALSRAFQIGARTASVGFDWSRAGDVIAKILEEVDEVREVVDTTPDDGRRLEEEMGDLLFAMANWSRKLGVDPETALRKANAKFARRFTAMEERIARQGRTLGGLTLEQMEAEWEAVKQHERTSAP